ncbi:hypothetical protein B0H67DRAFT_492546 [Lasiosphaeris hirsuta]|uniref:Uncharacterized protein n=1 Tax=Lasiosphaeris hirsuta TaxID=260670 RepID=A0AA40A7Y5_9PEZI|nr:hypothetical protein B0H67DRAFT_492546 [Lasiosphaeris hirsuta]
METINNIATAASKAIWGPDTAHQEPVSGKSGDVSKGEPYDAGNMGSTHPASIPSPTNRPLPGTEPDELNTKSTAPDETGAQPVEMALPSRLKETTAAGTSTSTSTPSTTTPTNSTPPPPPPPTNPTTVKDSSAQPGDSTQGQNDVRSPSNPDAQHFGGAAVAAKDNVDDASGGLDVGDNPDKLDGPGPRPLEAVAREHGGNAGAALDANKKSSGVLGQEEHDSGSGELYVKSSGLRADGGDFDASAPGAGREADREFFPACECGFGANLFCCRFA